MPRRVFPEAALQGSGPLRSVWTWGRLRILTGPRGDPAGLVETARREQRHCRSLGHHRWPASRGAGNDGSLLVEIRPRDDGSVSSSVSQLDVAGVGKSHYSRPHLCPLAVGACPQRPRATPGLGGVGEPGQLHGVDVISSHGYRTITLLWLQPSIILRRRPRTPATALRRAAGCQATRRVNATSSNASAPSPAGVGNYNVLWPCPRDFSCWRWAGDRVSLSSPSSFSGVSYTSACLALLLRFHPSTPCSRSIPCIDNPPVNCSSWPALPA